MSFNLESSKSKEINETSEVKVDSEQLSETQETAENFDDCSLNEVQDSNENEVNAESLEEAEEDYDDCEAKIEEMEEKTTELAEEDDDFSDCGKEIGDQYVAEVTYTNDGEISQEESKTEVQEAYNECDDPEDMQQLRENANENEHIEVHNAEVVERPENSELGEEITEEEYEEAQEELGEAQENLEAQQEAAQEYQEDFENEINKHEYNVSEETESINNEVSEENKDSAEVEKIEDFDSEETGSEDLENMEDDSKVEAFEINEDTLNEDVPENVEKNTNIELNDETQDDLSKVLKRDELDLLKSGNDAINQRLEAQADDYRDKGMSKDEIRDRLVADKWNFQKEFLEDAFPDQDVSPNVFNGLSENGSKDRIEEIENSETLKKQLNQDEINSKAENDKISVAEAEEIIEEKKDEVINSLEEQSEVMDDEIEQKAEQIAENDEITDEEAKEQISETIKESVDAVEETADELEAEKTEQLSEKTEQSLQERIDDAFEKENVNASEINNLRDEHAAELQAKIEEKNSTEAELKLKFDEVLAKEKGSDEYRQSLQEYNVLQDKKSELVDQITTMEKQQDLLDKKSIELREAQIQKGSEAMAASAPTLAGVNMLQERYDQTYYDTKADKAELANIRDESSSAIKELSAEKDSIKQAMDAKMDEISEYVISNNMDRYDTAHDLRYQQMSAEYNAIKESYDRIGYSIVKLDENNKAITEQLGDDYVSMVELTPSSRIFEVNDGTDVPGETNYFIDEAKASEVLSPFKQGNWEQLTIQEQKQAIEKLADYNAEILGVEDKPRIVYYNVEDPCDFGGYSAKQNAIYINEYNMYDAAEITDTISHEYRHKYQYERAEKLETERDLEFKEGFDNYIRAEDDYQGYKEQLVEADARAYAKVIQDKIDFTFEKEATDTQPIVDVDGQHTTFEDLNPEKGAVWEVPPHSENYKEIKPLVSDAKEATPPSLEHRGFLTNDGERITYEEAVNRITGNAEEYMSRLNVNDEIKTVVVADMRSELYKQHLEAESRGLGDHGIRHIYGNFERGEQYLSSRSDISDEQKLAVLVAQVYHDEGYTVSPNNLGTLNERYSDIDHDKASVEIWNEPERQNIYRQVFTENALDSVKVAIGDHNSGEIDDIQSNTSIDADPVVSTVHVCDKLALSQREKFSELLTSDPKLVELTESMNATLKTLQDERLGFYDGGKLTSQGKKFLEDYHQIINDHIDSQGYGSEYAQRLKDAVNKDVGFNSGKFSSRMNYIYTPSDCYQYNSETGRNEITVFVIEHSDGTSNDLAYKQVDKLYEDLGLSDSEIELAKANGGYDFGEARGLSVKIESIKEDDIRQAEAERFQENNDLKEVNECIEAGRKDYRELSQKLTEIVSLTDGDDLSYNTYCEVAFRSRVVVDFDEQEFETYSSAEKEQLVRNVVSNMVLSNTTNILDK